MKREFTKTSGIPTKKSGIQRKIGSMVINTLFGKKK